MHNSDFIIEDGKLIKYTGNSKNVIIPDEVTVIGENAFSHKDIKSVTMPSVVKIERKAFFDCKYLKNVVFSSVLEEIEKDVFDYCTSLKSINIPKSVKCLGAPIFYVEFNNFESLTFEERNDKLIFEGILFYISSSKKPLKIILPKHPIKRKDNTGFICISHSYIKYLELDYFDIEFFKFHDVRINNITVRIYDDELDNFLLHYDYHPDINTIIFESTDNLDKKNLIIYEITKSRNKKELKKVNIIFNSKNTLTKEEQKIYDELCRTYNVSVKTKEINKKTPSLNELSDIKELEELKINISKMSLELQSFYNNKLNEIIRKYKEELLNCEPTFETSNDITLSTTSVTSPRINLINKINLLLIDSRIHISNFGLKICNTINYLENKEEDNIFINVKELVSIIDLLDSKEKEKYTNLLKNILLKYQNKIKEKTLNPDNYEINLTLSGKSLELSFNEEIEILKNSLISFIDSNSLKINFIKSLENINDGYYKDKYLYYKSLSDEDLNEVFISFIDKARNNKIESVVLEFNTYFNNLIKQKEIEVLKDSIINDKDINIKNMTHNIDVFNYLTIYSFISDIKNISNKYNFNNDIKNKIDNIKEKLINDIKNIINNLDSETALKEACNLCLRFESYINRMNTYEKELVRVREK